MILQALCEYYEACAASGGEIARFGYSDAGVSFALQISWTGDLLSVIPLKEEVRRGKKTVYIPKRMIVPEQATRTVGVMANFLCDNGGYLLGVDAKGKPERTRRCFEAAKALHLSLLGDVEDPAARAVCAFFTSWNPDTAQDNPVLADSIGEIMGGALLVFFLPDDRYAQDVPALQAAWDAHASNEADAVRMPCLVTGKPDQPVALIHNKIKGVRDAQAVGATLVGFNAPAYESYGCDKDQGLNAPVSRYAAFAYTTALNKLLADTRHKKQIGDMTIVYWAKSGETAYADVFSMTLDPRQSDDQKLDAILSPLSRGEMLDIEAIDQDMPFTILGLSPNAARISVRLFLRGTFGAMLKNLAAHYARIDIVRAPYEPTYLTPYELLLETTNRKASSPTPAPLLAGAVLRAILENQKYPEALLTAVLLRIRAELNITRAKAAILRGYLIKNRERDEGEIKMALNESCTDRAYVLGRLFAVLEKAQMDANPGINTTIKDRYFASACATPAAVFPTLLKLSRSHIAKAEYGYVSENAIAKLMDLLDAKPFPTRLDLEEESMFYLGYYHQVQTRYQKKNTEEVK